MHNLYAPHAVRGGGQNTNVRVVISKDLAASTAWSPNTPTSVPDCDDHLGISGTGGSRGAQRNKFGAGASSEVVEIDTHVNVAVFI